VHRGVKVDQRESLGYFEVGIYKGYLFAVLSCVFANHLVRNPIFSIFSNGGSLIAAAT